MKMRELISKIALWTALCLMAVSFTIDTIIVFAEDWFEAHDHSVHYLQYAFMVASVPPFMWFLKNHLIKREKLEEKLSTKEQELKLRLDIIDRSTGIAEFAPDGTLLSANKKFLNMLGYSREEVIGQNHRMFMPDHLVYKSSYAKFWEDMRRGMEKSGEWNRINKSGKDVWVLASYIPNKDHEGNVVKITKIAADNTKMHNTLVELDQKNTYLEHAAKILRHDMHSGINTYIPRGLRSLERRLDKSIIEKLKIEAPIKMIKEGLKHTQKVYRGVYEFTNLVKKDAKIERSEYNIKEILDNYLSATSYKSSVVIGELPTISVNESLFCTAIDNLIRNGLRYNDSDTKLIKIYQENNAIVIEDNGRGLKPWEFEEYSKPYTRRPGQKESGSGLGLNICIAILKEHGFSISCDKPESKIGTKLTIHYK